MQYRMGRMSGEERKFQTRIGTVVLVCLFVSRNSFSFSQLHIQTLGTVNTTASIRFYIIHRALNSNSIMQLFGITTVLLSKLDRCKWLPMILSKVL